MKANPGPLLILGLLAGIPVSLAAETPTEGTLQEIVVTAERRSENLQDVPIAITAVSGDALDRAGATSITALADVTPGLQMQTTQGSVAPRIRGVGSDLPNVENSVAIYVDGVYIASPSASLLSLNNIAQVETLKGPQGTLFGRNATGGALLIQTPDPTQNLSGKFDIGYGDYQTTTLNGYVADGLTPSVAADLALHVSHQGEGYGRNLFTGSEVYQANLDLALRSKWVFKPTDTDTVHFIVDFARRNGSTATVDYIPAGTYPSAFLLPPVTTPIPRPYNINTYVDPTDSLTQSGVSARVDHEMNWAKLTSITAYRHEQITSTFDITLTPSCCLGVPVPFPPFVVTVPLPVVNIDSKDEQFSQELQLSSPDNSRSNWLTWVTGLYYFHDLQTQANSFTDVTTNSYSGFGEAHVEILPATRLVLGLRYTDEEKALSVRSGYYSQPEPPGTPVPPVTAVPTTWFSQLTYRLGLDHKFDNGTLIYASKNLGFKSGGYNSSEPSLPSFAPEKLNAYEAGFKSELLDRKVRWNGAAFYYRYTNIQMVKLTADNQIQEYNGPPATVYGVDFDAEARVTQELTFLLGASYVHDRFTADTPTVQWNVPNPPFPGGSTAFFASARGHELPHTPTWTTNVGLNYSLDSRIGNWTANANFLHSSGWFGEPDNQLSQRPYNSIDASVYVRPMNQPFSIGLWGRNLSNGVVYAAVSGNALTSLAQYAPPRTYGIKFSVDF
ncbi:MAG TPA: TonB-dependent receptor plug domain-containing protein [Steroidobacteraceae bacterium]|nr:TonB-dependent receptor plug domain-containing protein [Steroidobacteraceae bacterium]